MHRVARRKLEKFQGDVPAHGSTASQHAKTATSTQLLLYSAFLMHPFLQVVPTFSCPAHARRIFFLITKSTHVSLQTHLPKAKNSAVQMRRGPHAVSLYHNHICHNCVPVQIAIVSLLVETQGVRRIATAAAGPLETGSAPKMRLITNGGHGLQQDHHTCMMHTIIHSPHRRMIHTPANKNSNHLPAISTSIQDLQTHTHGDTDASQPSYPENRNVYVEIHESGSHPSAPRHGHSVPSPQRNQHPFTT